MAGRAKHSGTWQGRARQGQGTAKVVTLERRMQPGVKLLQPLLPMPTAMSHRSLFGAHLSHELSTACPSMTLLLSCMHGHLTNDLMPNRRYISMWGFTTVRHTIFGRWTAQKYVNATPHSLSARIVCLLNLTLKFSFGQTGKT